eukprot:CAMPEP_0172623948 /NCGR_PEP_ID=MMETSP1068-20121228/132810_1 /TAXON_ID=35684 /ORGANISM="Pseudopedinella elastica, Strain CCMP716" /LENGTH=190 /DNA_ID=CAMNT_0013432703 /DNA_START=17 /DNA_END=585 /DNA_ORIENTATION=+
MMASRREFKRTGASGRQAGGESKTNNSKATNSKQTPTAGGSKNTNSKFSGSPRHHHGSKPTSQRSPLPSMSFSLNSGNSGTGSDANDEEQEEDDGMYARRRGGSVTMGLGGGGRRVLESASHVLDSKVMQRALEATDDAKRATLGAGGGGKAHGGALAGGSVGFTSGFTMPGPFANLVRRVGLGDDAVRR